MLDPDLVLRVNQWIAQDPDGTTVAELTALLARALTDEVAARELTDAFRAPLEFGTAGLRGALGAGPNRMNRITVIQAAAGLAQYLLDQGHEGASVVIGYDARHNSKIFAEDTARVLSARGFFPELFADVVPTPVLAFAIRSRHACAGVMVTASHNPAQDNGYKVYLGDGRQIVPPADSHISELIRAVTDIRQVPMGALGVEISSEVVTAYSTRVQELISAGPTHDATRQTLTTVYTAMHGVGWQTLHSIVLGCGFAPLHAVAEQRDPDPDFPTVAFPNPEEYGALDLALAQAKECKADLLLANDPDADRLAVALPGHNGEWSALRGDQVGILLAWWIIERAKVTGKPIRGTFANSIVSSMMLEPLALSHGLDYAHTLTGFKWVSRVPNLIFGYEEALGYCVDPDAVGDKDGISAAVTFMELVTYLKADSRTVWDVWDELETQFGVHHTAQVSVRVSDVSQVTSVMQTLRAHTPTHMGALELLRVVDLSDAGSELPPTDALMMHFSGEGMTARVIVRPSGTEPKIKCYLEVVCQGPTLEANRQRAASAAHLLTQQAEPLLTGAHE